MRRAYIPRPESRYIQSMRLSVKNWRRLLVQLGAAIVIAWSLSCGASPSQPTTPTTPNLPSCSVRLWACSTSGYGAIAYSSSTRASGISYNWGTRSQAEASAIEYCGKSDCAIVAWFQNSCGAIATAPSGEMATGTGTTGDSAQAFAMTSCLAR